MPDDLKRLMLAYSRKGLHDWGEADEALKKTARWCLCNGIAEQSQDLEFTVDGRHADPQFIPAPRHGGSDFEWCFFLPKRTRGQLEALLLFVLVDRRDKNCLAFRFECSTGGRHGYSHVQLTPKLSKSRLSAMDSVDALNAAEGFLPQWLPDSYPAFPIPAEDWIEMFLAMMTAVHGHRDGIDSLIRDLFKDGSSTGHARRYNEMVEKMLRRLS